MSLNLRSHQPCATSQGRTHTCPSNHLTADTSHKTERKTSLMSVNLRLHHPAPHRKVEHTRAQAINSQRTQATKLRIDAIMPYTRDASTVCSIAQAYTHVHQQSPQDKRKLCTFSFAGKDIWYELLAETIQQANWDSNLLAQGEPSS